MRMTASCFAAIISIALFAVPARAQRDDFAALQAMSAADLGEAVPAGQLPQAKKYGVTYRLNGVLTVDGEDIRFNTADGRVFSLDMSLRKARRFDGETVNIRAKAIAADDMETLKVDEIALFDPAEHDIQLPPRQAKRRAAKVLAETKSGIEVENVRWLYDAEPSAGKFDWATAVIRPELVKKAYFVKKPFPPEWLAAHSLFVFTFEDGGLTDAAGNKASGLVLTIEAFLREGQVYDLKTGLKDRFGIVWLLTTWEDYVARTALNDKARLVPYEVRFPKARTEAMLREALRLASVNRDGEFYHTVTNNCTNNLLMLMNRVLPEKQRMRMWTIPYLVYNVRATMPVVVPGYLQGKGLLGPEMGTIDASNYPRPLD
ncbi:MAG TPA: DUF4105 domain-containing protein [Elusimicrobiales bacterium]|nr:DUF4105 domain-containing protein [Elusimicrobiales bacterium]